MNQARILDPPFYRTGQVRIGERGFAIILELLEELRPQIVLVAGDLSEREAALA